MAKNTFHKVYLAILKGTLTKSSGIINAPIARKENSIIERCIDPNGDTAITEFKVIKQYEKYALVQFNLKTGRTHQIRVHSSYIGHPILGDTLYSTPSELIKRQALHSYKICFIHPIKNISVNYISNLPNDMLKLLTLNNLT